MTWGSSPYFDRVDQRFLTSEAVLTKAIEKAFANGWKPLNLVTPGSQVAVQQWQGTGMVELAILFSDASPDIKWVRELEGIIFNHDFAKALWIQNSADYEELGDELWKDRLQEMVIAPDPIKYLGEHL